jgi:hypothetical protein
LTNPVHDETLPGHYCAPANTLQRSSSLPTSLQASIAPASALAETNRLFQPYQTPRGVGLVEYYPHQRISNVRRNNISTNIPSHDNQIYSTPSTLTIPRPPRIDLTQLRNQRHNRKANHGYINGTRSGTSKPKSNKYGAFVLPKIFKFIIIPYNGTESGVTPYVPRRTTQLYTTLENERMIKDIRFDQGDPEYCLSRVRTAFNHLPLETFRFYRAYGSGLSLTPVEAITFETFDITTLAEYVPIQ